MVFGISSFRHFTKSPHLVISSFRRFMAASGISSFRHFVIWRTREGYAPPQKFILAFRYFTGARPHHPARSGAAQTLWYVWVCLGFVLFV